MKIFLGILAILLLVAVCYLAVALVCWEINIIKWDISARVLFLTGSVFLIFSLAKQGGTNVKRP